MFEGIRFRGSEQLFQLQKAGDPGTPAFNSDAFRFANADESTAYSLGHAIKLRPDWEQAKGGCMMRALRAKFRGDASLRTLLQSTRGVPLVAVKSDAYWGTGSDGASGRNMLGQLLMRLRDELAEDPRRHSGPDVREWSVGATDGPGCAGVLARLGRAQ